MTAAAPCTPAQPGLFFSTALEKRQQRGPAHRQCAFFVPGFRPESVASLRPNVGNWREVPPARAHAARCCGFSSPPVPGAIAGVSPLKPETFEMTNPACLYPLPHADFQTRLNTARATLNRATALIVTAHRTLIDNEDQLGAAMILELVEGAIEHADTLLCDGYDKAETP